MRWVYYYYLGYNIHIIIISFLIAIFDITFLLIFLFEFKNCIFFFTDNCTSSLTLLVTDHNKKKKKCATCLKCSM